MSPTPKDGDVWRWNDETVLGVVTVRIDHTDGVESVPDTTNWSLVSRSVDVTEELVRALDCALPALNGTVTLNSVARSEAVAVLSALHRRLTS